MEILNTFNKIYYKNSMHLCDKSELKLFLKHNWKCFIWSNALSTLRAGSYYTDCSLKKKKRYTVFVSKFILENDPNGLINLIQFIFQTWIIYRYFTDQIEFIKFYWSYGIIVYGMINTLSSIISY